MKPKCAGKKLGEGETSTIYEYKCDPKNYVVKVVKHKKSCDGVRSRLRIERQMQARFAARDAAPRVYSHKLDNGLDTVHTADTENTENTDSDSEIDWFVMERVVPLQNGDMLTEHEQCRIIRLLVATIRDGLLHNDLHQRNIGRAVSDNRILFLDFGCATAAPPSVIPLIQHNSFLLWGILLGQLYTVVESENQNNMLLDLSKSTIMDAIYLIRQNKIADLEKLLLEQIIEPTHDVSDKEKNEDQCSNATKDTPHNGMS